jgi:arylsulfatase
MKDSSCRIILAATVISIILAGCNRSTDGDGSIIQLPNILIILADDMGFSDLGCYGGEILTPNIDKLATKGIRYTQFYNSGRCCPTRASLLTGLYSHQTGMGWMTAADLGTEGYTGEISRQCVTLAEVLGEEGYATYMVGKWHVTSDAHTVPEGPKDSWPIQRGFDKYYGPHHGGGSFFKPTVLTYNNERISPGEGYYVTEALSDTAAQFIEAHPEDRPFFLYLAYTAPHFPLHAKPEDIDKYLGSYMEGWDSLRIRRYRKMREIGLIDEQWPLTSPMEDVRPWSDLDEPEKKEYDRRMAVYAAQIDNMDQGIGRIVKALENRGMLENTVILFLSDNGGTAEYISRGDPDPQMIGSEESYESYRKPWATMSNTPLRLFKQWVHEGGISTPLIVHWPHGIRDKGAFRYQVGHVIDIMPTCLELAGAKYPDLYLGQPILPMEGVSLVSSFNGGKTVERTLFWEHQATRAVRVGEWKLVANRASSTQPYIGTWELYNLDTDRSETIDLREAHHEKVLELDSLWDAWATRCHVYPLDGRGWFKRLEN